MTSAKKKKKEDILYSAHVFQPRKMQSFVEILLHR